MANIVEDVVFVLNAKDLTGTAYSSAKAGLSSLHDKSRDIAAQMDSHWQAFKKNWLGVSAAFYAGFELIKKGWNMAEIAAGYNEHMQLIDGLAKQYGTSSTAIVNRIREIGDGMLSLTNIAETVDSAMTKGISPDRLYGLAEAAVVLSDSMKVTADEAFKRLAEAMETGKEKSIKLAVGVIDLKDRYGDMADKMTEAEKQTALYNIVMEKAREIQARTGGETKSTADKMEALGVRLQDIKLTIGEGMLRAWAGLVGAFQSISAASLTVSSGIWKIIEAKQTLQTYVSWGEAEKQHADAASYAAQAAAADWKASLEWAGKAQDNFALMVASSDELQRATAKQTAAVQQHTQSEGARQKIVAETVKALEAYSKALQKYGEEQLKIAKETFGDRLKEENVTIASMKTNLDAYLATLRNVYDARIAGERAIADTMAKAGASPKDQLEAQARILKSEKEYLVERLGGWRLYYNTLVAQHDKAADAMAKKTGELKKLEEDLTNARKSSIEKLADLQVQLLQAQGKADNSYEVYMTKTAALEDLWRLAMQKTGEERIKLLQDYISKAGQMTGEVKQYGEQFSAVEWKMVQTAETVVTKQDAINLAMQRTEAGGNEIVKTIDEMKAAKEREITAIVRADAATTQEMNHASAEMRAYIDQIDLLAQRISAMDKVISLSVNDNASGPIVQIRALLATLQDKVINVTVRENMIMAGAGATGLASASASQSSAAPAAGGGSTWTLPGDDWFLPQNDMWGQNLTPEGSVSSNLIPGSNYMYMGTGALTMPDWGGEPWFGSYASGTKRVPRTGPYLLHEGEAVGTKAEVQASQGNIVTFQPGSIVIQGKNKSGEQIVDEIMKPLMRRMKEVNFLRE